MSNNHTLITKKNLWSRKTKFYWVNLPYSCLPGSIKKYTVRGEGLHEDGDPMKRGHMKMGPYLPQSLRINYGRESDA